MKSFHHVKLDVVFQFFRDDMGLLRYRCDELDVLNAHATEWLANMIGEELWERQEE